MQVRRFSVRQKALDPRLVAVTAVMSAVVYVLTRMVQIPTSAQGYVHLGDAAIFFASFAFGPWVGGIAGALGTALADLTTGFPQWAPFSFAVHGLEGVVVGLVVYTASRSASRSGQVEWYRLLVAVGLGSLVVVVGYFIAGTILEGVALALTEIPANIVQALSGGLIGTPLFVAVRRAYPPLVQR
jgi:uncharacterized membrane protein